jgi:hypothetical protein
MSTITKLTTILLIGLISFLIIPTAHTLPTFQPIITAKGFSGSSGFRGLFGTTRLAGFSGVWYSGGHGYNGYTAAAGRIDTQPEMGGGLLVCGAVVAVLGRLW